ncbi:secretion protein [Chryseobacterium lactis]|uniref:Secretion protein n=1 Tax=Chryseobacterium lactis TaxID=1241981 RepID=A0A3G6RUY4_CHRLC|nr:T9SS type A sorting domain-containing protein [Chryseobacterium lactis]AZA84952.1 T9SS C-terminal target domain-containing protein [Chryseobacterium lactis]AZB05340.1 T9SS C-terminal target domain-containing protein [Chryseobacterium lactis]PNW11489.1 secretion protein [Chryseobacterium lactis]
MKKNYLGALFLCMSLGYFDAQELLWQRDIKSSTQDFLSQITTTIDGQYLITGSSIQAKGQLQEANSQKPNTGYEFHLVKLDQQGNQAWEKYFSGGNHDYLSSTVSTQDGGFLISGTSFSGKGGDKKDDSKGGSDIWLIRLNEFGDELWQRTLGTSADEEAKSVIQTTDLGFFVVGDIQKPGSKDVLLTKLDKDGKIQSEIIISGCGVDEAQKLIPTMDGGALLGMYSRSGVCDVKQLAGAPKPSSETIYSKKTENYGEGDFWVIKLDKNGKIQWEKNYGGKGDDHLRTLALTSGGYIIGGESRSEKSGNKTVGIEEGTDLWLIALDNNGNEQWQKSYNLGNRDVLMGMSSIHSADDKETKGLLIGGFTQAEGRIQENDETFWLLYIDSQGNEKWRKHVKGESRQREERLSDLKLNRDGSIILAGTSAEESGKENWKIVKLGDKQVDQLIEKYDIKIYPNPVSDYAYVEIGFKDVKEVEILLYDMSGRQLQNLKTKNKVTKINTQALIQGAYLVTIKTDAGKTASAKLIKK